jgi:hypothetical protein
VVGRGFSPHYAVVFFFKNYLIDSVIVRFDDIGGIVNHHCLSFLFNVDSEWGFVVKSKVTTFSVISWREVMAWDMNNIVEGLK